MESKNTKGKPEGVRYYIDGREWDGKIGEIQPEPNDNGLETLPKVSDSMTLELTIGPQFALSIVETMCSAIYHTARKLTKWAIETFKEVAEAANKSMNKLMDSMLYHANSNPKWWHLYKHAKKQRIRKKYRRRLMQQLLSTLEAAATA